MGPPERDASHVEAGRRGAEPLRDIKFSHIDSLRRGGLMLGWVGHGKYRSIRQLQ